MLGFGAASVALGWKALATCEALRESKVLHVGCSRICTEDIHTTYSPFSAQNRQRKLNKSMEKKPMFLCKSEFSTDKKLLFYSILIYSILFYSIL